ncbi:AAA family ATPase [Prosthecobacter debontii]|nr:AAA family ATPase [Prosthecobacter debontii]
MIHKLSIRNFKSIRELDLDCRRVNVFIGEPNVGKTNILEALSLWSFGTLCEIKKTLRINHINQLATDISFDQGTHVQCDDFKLTAYWTHLGAFIDYEIPGFETSKYKIDEKSGDVDCTSGQGYNEDAIKIHYYLFDPREPTDSGDPGVLVAPFGNNLAGVLSSNREARQAAGAFLEGSRYRLAVDRASRNVFLASDEDGTMTTLPYLAASETLRRMIFYQIVLATNRDAVLVFDEPEAHSFPPYTKTLAERIALDDQGNQFFLTTHSPYMLDSLLSKTPASELNVVLCRMENYATKAYALNQDQIDQIKEWSMDAFFNFDRLLPEVE